MKTLFDKFLMILTDKYFLFIARLSTHSLCSFFLLLTTKILILIDYTSLVYKWSNWVKYSNNIFGDNIHPIIIIIIIIFIVKFKVWWIPSHKNSKYLNKFLRANFYLDDFSIKYYILNIFQKVFYSSFIFFPNNTSNF